MTEAYFWEMELTVLESYAKMSERFCLVQVLSLFELLGEKTIKQRSSTE